MDDLSKLEQEHQNEVTEYQDNSQMLERASALFDEVVYKGYLSSLSSADILNFHDKLKRPIRWYQITKIVYEKGVFFTDKMAMVYAALHHVCSVVALSLRKRHGKIELYIGTRDQEGSDFVSGDILSAGLKGILPGIELDDRVGAKDMLSDIPDAQTAISCVSGVASLVDDKKENFIQGIENLIDSTDKLTDYTALIIAKKVSATDTAEILSAYENLYSEISPLAQVQMNYNFSQSKGVSETITKGFNNSVSNNVSKTVSHGTSKSQAVGENRGITSGGNIGGGIIIVSGGYNRNYSFSQSVTDTLGMSDNTSDQQGQTVQVGINENEAKGTTVNVTSGQTMQFTRHNRYVKSCMDVLDRQIERLAKSAPSGMWSVATYFVASDNTTCSELAGIYRGIIVGEKSEVENVTINLWPRIDEGDGNKVVSEIKKYLGYQLHPQFILNKNMVCTAGSMVDSHELAVHLSLPQSSVPGILVRKEQSFGRNVKAHEKLNEENSIALGKIIHLGEVYEDDVRVSIDGLAKHTLVTGTTGSGKSNTLYLLLDELRKKGKHFLVIEPAKGEYKNVFGHQEAYPGVKVFGTNPRISQLLTINPFIFPDDIDVYEHIDSLVEIFNACWPMYAAMPQVMKHSIMEAYKACGWNLDMSLNPLGIYPTIEDVLIALREYINSSEYSSDTKGDYKGSLETRLQSLCEGLVGRMFKGEPVSDEELFNGDAIVDLSRVKASETKSLLMGLLVMKLNEFRVSERKGMNQQLRHVTVLEEAHNLLKRTSTTQSAETSNVAGMAVEKIANSMAEMRTYGEGFIIADQSPSMLDMATIRNTNTKIIMSLPEKEDRDTAGKSVGLDDEHIMEIARLKTGEAVVYQNGWEEPVKAKINFFRQSDKEVWQYEPEKDKKPNSDSALMYVYGVLYDYYSHSEDSCSLDFLRDLIKVSSLCGTKKVTILNKLQGKETITVDECAQVMAILVGTDLCLKLQSASDIELMNRQLYQALLQLDGLRDNEHIEVFANMYMRGCSMMAKEPFYEEWQLRTIKSHVL